MAIPLNTFPFFRTPTNLLHSNKYSSSSSFSICRSQSINSEDDPPKKKSLSEQSSWEVKDSEGKDYLYRLGQEADNMNIAVGARSGVIDDLFAGNFLGKDGQKIPY